MFLVVDNAFNRANYPDLIGQTFENPPSYARVEKMNKSFDEVCRAMKLGEQITLEGTVIESNKRGKTGQFTGTIDGLQVYSESTYLVELSGVVVLCTLG